MEQRIAIIGAGITGLATATLLQEAGYQISVFEQAEAPALGASGHNGAQLSYSYVAPLADAGIWKQLPKLMLDPASPLKIKPSLDPALLRWLAGFAVACNNWTARKTTAALLELGRLSCAEINRLPSEVLKAAHHQRSGKLVIYRSEEALSGARVQVELQRKLGSKQQILTAGETLAVEPALRNEAAHIAGAVYTPSEEVIDCSLLCQALAQRLERQGAQLHYAQQLVGWDKKTGARRIDALQFRSTTAGMTDAVQTLQFDHVVIASGSDTRHLLKPLGLQVPVYPLKGYSISVPLTDEERNVRQAPAVSVTDLARKIVFARVGTQLRVAGMAELVGHDRSIDPVRIAQLKDATRALFGPLANLDASLPWAGLRPATPTSRPVIGATPYSNLWLNVGHGALGLTMAFGAARMLQQAIAAQTLPAHTAMFAYA